MKTTVSSNETATETLLDCRSRHARHPFLSEVAGLPILVDQLQARILLELPLGPTGETPVRPEGNGAVPGGRVARVRRQQAEGYLVLARRLVDGQAEMIREGRLDSLGESL